MADGVHSQIDHRARFQPRYLRRLTILAGRDVGVAARLGIPRRALRRVCRDNGDRVSRPGGVARRTL